MIKLPNVIVENGQISDNCALGLYMKAIAAQKSGEDPVKFFQESWTRIAGREIGRKTTLVKLTQTRDFVKNNFVTKNGKLAVRSKIRGMPAPLSSDESEVNLPDIRPGRLAQTNKLNNIISALANQLNFN